MNAATVRTTRVTRRLGTLLAISAASVGISAAVASAQPGSNPGGGPAPTAKQTLIDYASLGSWTSGDGGRGGQPIVGLAAGAGPINPAYATPVITIVAPQSDLAGYPGGAMLSTTASNVNTSYQLRMDCADGFRFQGPTQVFTGVGVGSTAKSLVPAGAKALEWPAVTDRRALNPSFARHYAGAGCTIQMATLPTGRQTARLAGVTSVTPLDNDPIDAGWVNQQGFFSIAVVTAGGPGGGL